MSLTNKEIWERQRFRRSDPIWQLIYAVQGWANWYYDEWGGIAAERQADAAWLKVEEKEAFLRKLLDEAWLRSVEEGTE
jgi:hypothetical protein